MPEEERRDRTSASTNHQMFLTNKMLFLLENPDILAKPPPLRKMSDEAEGPNYKRRRTDDNCRNMNI